MSYDAVESSRHDGQPVKCLRFAQGGSTWLYTTADKPITLATGTYAPELGISVGELDFSQEDTGGELLVTLSKENAVVAIFLDGDPSSPVTLTVYDVHRSDLASPVVYFTGEIGPVMFDGAAVQFRCEHLGGKFDQLVPSIAMQARCPWATYGEGCGVNRFDFRDTVTVTSTTGFFATSAGFDARADGWFRNGYLETLGGHRYWVVEHVGAIVTLQKLPTKIVAGDVVYAFAGDDHTEATCLAKFNNLARHLGHPRMQARSPFLRGAV